jgi:uncharacterized membrane protein
MELHNKSSKKQDHWNPFGATRQQMRLPREGIVSFFNRHATGLVTLSFVALGAYLRFHANTFQSYWLDEVWSISASNPSVGLGEMYGRTVVDVHPPLYQIILWLCFKVFGYSEGVGRNLSGLFGTLGLLAVYFLGQEAYNKKVGMYAVVVASTNYFLVYYSQEVRSYALLFFVFMYELFALVEARQKTILEKAHIPLFIVYHCSLLHSLLCVFLRCDSSSRVRVFLGEQQV